MKKILGIIFVLFSFLFFFAESVFAASVSVSAPTAVSPGENFSVDILADTDGVSINSIRAELSYDEEILDFSGYKEDGSVIRLWVDYPHAENGQISLSGIIPGGISGIHDPTKKDLTDIPLVRLLFTAKASGVATLSFIDSEILKNDGRGTSLEHERRETSIEVGVGVPVSGSVNSDKTPPLPFILDFLGSSFFSKTPPLIIFNATDLDSGIKKYQIKIDSSTWQEAQSPAPVNLGIFPRTVTVRAFDYYGNFQASSITIPGLVSLKLLLPIILLLLVGILGYKMIKLKK